MIYVYGVAFPMAMCMRCCALTWHFPIGLTPPVGDLSLPRMGDAGSPPRGRGDGNWIRLSYGLFQSLGCRGFSAHAEQWVSKRTSCVFHGVLCKYVTCMYSASPPSHGNPVATSDVSHAHVSAPCSKLFLSPHSHLGVKLGYSIALLAPLACARCFPPSRPCLLSARVHAYWCEQIFVDPQPVSEILG